MESLFKLRYNFQPYDLLIMDESESNLKQFSSRNTMKRIRGCVDMFQELLTTSGRVICADAFLTQRTIDCIKNFIPSHQIHIIENTFIPDPREAIEIEEFEEFKLKMTDSLDKGKKIVAVFASSTKAQDFYEEVKFYYNKKGEEMPKTKIYYAQQSDQLNNLKNIDVVKKKPKINNQNIKKYIKIITPPKVASDTAGDEGWSSIQLLIYSPLITVGVNFDPVVVHFDEIFIYGSAMSCTIRDIFQSSMRVRKLNDNKLYFNINSQHVGIKPDTLWGTKIDIMNRQTQIEIFDLINYTPAGKSGSNEVGDEEEEECPSWLYMNNLFNEFEENFHRMNYRPVFLKFLEKCGYTISKNSIGDIEADNEDLQLYELVDNSSTVEPYNNIPEITSNTFKLIKHNIERKEATRMEKLQYEKYKFIRSFKKDTDEDVLEDLWNNFYSVCPLNKKYFFNMKDEKRLTPEEIRKREQYKKLADVRAVQMDKILNINHVLGLKNSQDMETIIPYDKILELQEIVIPQIEELNELFGFRDRYGKGEKEKSDTYVLIMFLKKIYHTWTGCDFVVEESTKTKTRTINGKRVRTPSYSLDHEFPCYEFILDRCEKWNQHVPDNGGDVIEEIPNKIISTYAFDYSGDENENIISNVLNYKCN
jgi:hypothetical protein